MANKLYKCDKCGHETADYVGNCSRCREFMTVWEKRFSDFRYTLLAGGVDEDLIPMILYNIFTVLDESRAFTSRIIKNSAKKKLIGILENMENSEYFIDLLERYR